MIRQKEIRKAISFTQSLKNRIPRNCWVLVAHTCYPSYSAGRDQEYHGLKPAWGKNSPVRPYLRNKMGWWNGPR
jgi:hypothetical protein